MSIEREQPSIAFRSMPHYSNYGSTRFSAQPIDELTGKVDALNETTNIRPTQSEVVGVIHPSYMPDPRGYDPGPIGSLSETFGDGDPRILGPISGNGVFKPQDIDAKGSATSFEVRVFYRIDADIQRPTHPNDNIGTNSDSYFGDEIHFFTPVASQNGTATFAGSFNLEKGDLPMEGEIFQPAAGMNSFGESLNPVLEVGGTAGPGATSFMTGQFDVPMDNIAIEKM